MSRERVGPSCSDRRPISCATSLAACGSAPSSAIARMYRSSRSVTRSVLTRKKLESSFASTASCVVSHVREGHGARIGVLPHQLAVFLKEVRISLGVLDDRLDRL